MEGEFGDVGTFHKKVEASSGPHGGAHGGEDGEAVVVFVGVLEVFFSEGVCMRVAIPRLKPMPVA